MNIKCLLGIHDWDYCVCVKCKKKRNKGHIWDKNGVLCEKCGTELKVSFDLNQAVRVDDIKLAKYFIEKGVNVNCKT